MATPVAPAARPDGGDEGGDEESIGEATGGAATMAIQVASAACPGCGDEGGDEETTGEATLGAAAMATLATSNVGPGGGDEGGGEGKKRRPRVERMRDQQADVQLRRTARAAGLADSTLEQRTSTKLLDQERPSAWVKKNLIRDTPIAK